MIWLVIGIAIGVGASYLLTHKEYRILLFSHVYETCVHAGQWIKERKLPF